MYSWWWLELSPETCRVKPLRRINAVVASCWIYFTTTKVCVDWRRSRNASLESDICTARAVAGFSFPCAKYGCEREFMCAIQWNTRSDACNSLPLLFPSAPCSPVSADVLVRRAAFVLYVNSGFRREVDESRAPLCCYAASSDNSLPNFLDSCSWKMWPKDFVSHFRQIADRYLNKPRSLCSTFSAIHYFQHPIIRRSVLTHNICSVSVSWIPPDVINCAFIRVWDS